MNHASRAAPAAKHSSVFQPSQPQPGWVLVWTMASVMTDVVAITSTTPSRSGSRFVRSRAVSRITNGPNANTKTQIGRLSQNAHVHPP